MKNKIIIGIGLVILAIGAFVFLTKNNSSQITPASSSPQPTVQVDQNTIKIKNFAFDPSLLTVKTGTTITWVNEDAVGHDIKADTFSSEILKQGEKYTHTFEVTGVFNYTCGVHPSMTGKITVE